MSQENASNKPLIRYVNRQQMSWCAVDVERLIGEEHPARAIWTLVGCLDLSSFYQGIESSTDEGGRPAFDPQLLISLWVYAYSQGIGSAREVARRCEYDPAFQWLTGLEQVNYHTLADFRVEKQKELDGLFTQVLAALSKEGMITLEQVMQDGTKITQVHNNNNSNVNIPAVNKEIARLSHLPPDQANAKSTNDAWAKLDSDLMVKYSSEVPYLNGLLTDFFSSRMDPSCDVNTNFYSDFSQYCLK